MYMYIHCLLQVVSSRASRPTLRRNDGQDARKIAGVGQLRLQTQLSKTTVLEELGITRSLDFAFGSKSG